MIKTTFPKIVPQWGIGPPHRRLHMKILAVRCLHRHQGVEVLTRAVANIMIREEIYKELVGCNSLRYGTIPLPFSFSFDLPMEGAVTNHTKSPAQFMSKRIELQQRVPRLCRHHRLRIPRPWTKTIRRILQSTFYSSFSKVFLDHYCRGTRRYTCTGQRILISHTCDVHFIFSIVQSTKEKEQAYLVLGRLLRPSIEPGYW